ncbi:hypothetical protein AAG906_013166 [Vitis piasezkii]
MATTNDKMVSVSQPAIPIFKGECYEFWSIKMKTLFKSQDLWDLVENGYPYPDEEARLKENTKKDSKALFFIQQAVHESIFSKIAAATTTKEAWTTLKTAFQGSSKVITVKLQSLRRDFETLHMKNGESVQDFLSRVAAIVNQMRSYGEDILDQTVVAKVLRSLTPKFDHVVATIEESKDLSTYSFDELMGSLQSHEVRLSRTEEKNEEKAFYTKERHRIGRMEAEAREKSETRVISSATTRKRFGHVQAECEKKERQEKQANYVEQEEDQVKLFMAYNEEVVFSNNIWFWIVDLDESHKLKVKLGDDKQVQVEVWGNLWLVDTPFCLMLFPLEVSSIEKHSLVVEETSESNLWHLRYGHLNVKGLKLLSKKEMVFVLPKIDLVNVCEGCIYGKQSKKPFPKGRYFCCSDDHNRMSWVYFLQSKAETFETFKKFKAFVEKQSGKCIKMLRTDRGGEFLSNDFKVFCEEEGLHRELTTPYSPEQNGVAERKNRTVVEMARNMMKAKNLSNHFWAEGVATDTC